MGVDVNTPRGPASSEGSLARTGDSARGAAIEARGIRKAFGDTQALAGVDLTAEAGRVLALLGPNGAGKTTLVRILTTLLRADSGMAYVAGLDVERDAPALRSLIGLSGQFAAIDEILTGRENLEMVGELYHLDRGEARARAAEALERFDLARAADRRAGTYSGGMRRRLDVAASLIGRPPVMILDEPTTGLDPRSRLEVWELVESLVADGTTVLLTTQYLEEADRLAHRIVVIDAGRVVAEGTADELKARVGGDRVELQVPAGEDFESVASVVAPSGISALALDRDRRRIALPAGEGTAALRATIDRVDSAGVAVEDIGIRRPSLDEVFMALTGKVPTEEEDAAAAPSDSAPLEDVSADAADGSRTQPAPAAVPSLPQGLASGGRDVAVLTRRNIRRIMRTPQLLAASSLQPLLFVLLFRYVFGGAIHVPGMSYVDYMLPAALLTTTLFAATTAVAMASDMQGGMIERFRSLPIARIAVLAARAIADLLRSGLVVVIVLALGFLIGFGFHNGAGGAIGAIALALAFGFAFIWIFALIGMYVNDPQTAQLVGMLPLFPLLFASSAFVPVATMPGWLQDFADVQPVSVTINATRALAEGGDVVRWLWLSLVWIVAILVVTIPLAVYRYRRT